MFVQIKKMGNTTFEVKVRISDIEVFDLMEYSNMFFNYRITSVWSPPEALKQLKKIPELSQNMDTYSFGMILWDLWHCQVPFDNEISQAQTYVIKEDARPKIIMSSQDNDSDEDEEDKEENKQNSKNNSVDHKINNSEKPSFKNA